MQTNISPVCLRSQSFLPWFQSQAQAMIRAATAHGKHEARTGKADPNWPDWYAEYIVREQSGEELPQ
jgi:hypothetical protein